MLLVHYVSDVTCEFISSGVRVDVFWHMFILFYAAIMTSVRVLCRHHAVSKAPSCRQLFYVTIMTSVRVSNTMHGHSYTCLYDYPFLWRIYFLINTVYDLVNDVIYLRICSYFQFFMIFCIFIYVFHRIFIVLSLICRIRYFILKCPHHLFIIRYYLILIIS